MTSSTTPVVFAPVLDPGNARQRLDVMPGLTIAQIVALVAPGQQPSSGHLRVTLTNDQGTVAVEERLWHRVRPNRGTTVVVRAVPGKDALRSVLLAVVSIAASFVAPILFPGLAVGSFGLSAATAGLGIIGSLLINALIPIETPDAQERRNVYRIDGWRNDIRPGAPIPCALGKHRYAPPLAAQSYTEVVGDDQYIRALFCLGYGPLRVSELRIGDTSVSDYEDIDIEIREGRPEDLPVSLYPRQVLEEGAGVQLVRPKPRNLSGEEIDGAEGVETPVIRFTAINTARASVILGFQAGLFHIDSKGRRRSQTVTIRIRARQNGLGDWLDVVTLDITADRQEAFLRQHSWDLPTRGRWQVEVTRMTDDNNDTQTSDTVILSAIQSIRPEYPINMDKPVALIAVRVRATYQLNGSLDGLNALIEREGMVRDAGEWTVGFGRNPATAFLTALMGPQNPYPVLESEIDLEQISDWYDWCDEKGLKYDRVHDAAEGFGDMLNAICGAGRASPRHDGVRWGVVIDRPETLVIDHINPRNSEQFEWSRDYFVPPDALRVRFWDESNNYEEAERIVPWPGYEGPIRLTEAIDLPGKTDPVEIWIEARRRMYELMHRADSFSAIQSGFARVATRGDLVMGSFDVLSRTQMAARVKSVAGQLIEVDEQAVVPDGYGVRFRVFGNADDLTGTSVVRPIARSDEETCVLLLESVGDIPEVGDVIHMGPIETTSLALRVRGIESGDDFSSRIIMIAAAPEIDVLTDAEVVPEWDGRVGAEIDISSVVPAVPTFVSIATGGIGTDDPDGLAVILQPGLGSTAQVTGYELDHRLNGTGAWTTTTMPAAASGVSIDAYSSNDQVDLRARAMAGTTPGAYTGLITLTIGGNDPAIPSALDTSAVSLIGGLGHVTLAIVIPTGSNIDALKLYRVPVGIALDREVHGLGAAVNVLAGSTYVRVDGDSTRVALNADVEFNNDTAYDYAEGWLIIDGQAVHVPGTASALSQSISITAGKTYRVALDVDEITAGSVQVKLTGGSEVLGDLVTTSGLKRSKLTAVSGNTHIALGSSSPLEGAFNSLTIFEETAGCVDAGDWNYWVEPLNSEAIAGPISGPFVASIL